MNGRSGASATYDLNSLMYDCWVSPEELKTLEDAGVDTLSARQVGKLLGCSTARASKVLKVAKQLIVDKELYAAYVAYWSSDAQVQCDLCFGRGYRWRYKSVGARIFLCRKCGGSSTLTLRGASLWKFMIKNTIK